MRAPNIFIINRDLPVFPGRAGHEYLNTTHLAKIVPKVGLVSMVHTREQKDKILCLLNAGINLYAWESPNLLNQQGNNSQKPSIMRVWANNVREIIGTWPMRPRDTFIEDFQFRNLSIPILQGLKDTKWDVVVVVQSTCARWLDYLPFFPVSVLVFHDVRSLVYERRAQMTKSEISKLLIKLDTKLYRKFERYYTHQYDLVITVSKADEEWVRENYNPKQLMTIPIPVDANYFSPIKVISEVNKRIMFTGMMDHLPNVDAACYFAREILPLVQQKVPDAEFWVVGRNPSSKVIALGLLPGVVITGFVEDIRPYIAQSGIIVVPLRFGSGMRNKILEAWGMQKCVVSTTIGAEGLDYQDGKNILIADDVPRFANQVCRLIEDENLRNCLREKGRQLIIEKHDPQKIATKYYNAIEKVYSKKKEADTPTRILVDLRWMRPGVAGGIENLSRAFISTLTTIDMYNEYTFLVPTEVSFDFDLRFRRNYRVLPFDGLREKWKDFSCSMNRFLHAKIGIDYWHSQEVENLRRLHGYNADIVLSMSGYIFTDMYPMKNVLIMPDLQHEYHPEFFSPQALEERKRVFGDSIKRAVHIIAISEHTRKNIIEKFGISPGKITTVHLAAEEIYKPLNPRQRGNAEVWKKYSLMPGEYLFFPGNTWPHKNHTGAIEALAVLRDKFACTPRLIFAGAVKEAQSQLIQRMRELNLENQIQFLGYCPIEEMPALYRGASMLVYPSYFEGFGIPLLEAMLCDCPIVCSNATSLPEVAGDAAIMVDPRSSVELAQVIYNVYTDQALRNQLIHCGREQVKKFSWRKFTLETLRILKDTAYGKD